MGGCIGLRSTGRPGTCVSSLYGRVYRLFFRIKKLPVCFLPVWEGVSGIMAKTETEEKFPPCMGGCIGREWLRRKEQHVSSLYGRVYRLFFRIKKLPVCFLPVWEGVSGIMAKTETEEKFPPCMGGCIGREWLRRKEQHVSSLYGRVYHRSEHASTIILSFLPVWEGVSRDNKLI